jgi:hypothetical protein
MNEIEIYHFTTPDQFKEIQKNGLLPMSLSNGIEFLVANSLHIELPESAFENVWYGIHPEHLELWKNNAQYKNTWDKLMTFVAGHQYPRTKENQIIQLSAKVPVEHLNVFDFGSLAKTLNIQDMIAKELMRAWAIEEYQDSQVPLTNYRGDYVLPEIVCSKTISPKNISLNNKFNYHIAQPINDAFLTTISRD